MFVLRGLFTASFPWQLNTSDDLKWISCFLSFLSSFIFNKEVPCCFFSCFFLHVREWRCCVPQTCQKSSCHQKDFDILIPKRLHLQSRLAERTALSVTSSCTSPHSGYSFCSSKAEFRTVHLGKYSHKKASYPSCPEPLKGNLSVPSSRVLQASHARLLQKREILWSQSYAELLLLAKGANDG